MRWGLGCLLLGACVVPPVEHVGPITGSVQVSGRSFSCSQRGVLEQTADGQRVFADAGFRAFALAGREPGDGVGAMLLVGGGLPAQAGRLTAFDLDGDVLAQADVGDDLVYGVAMTPPGVPPIAVAAGADGAVRCFLLPKLEPLPQPWQHGAAAVAVSFSPDGELLVSAGLDGKLLLGSIDGATAPQPLLDHTAPVTSVAWSADGQRFASGARDGKVRLHDRSGRLLRTWPRLGGVVQRVAFAGEVVTCAIEAGPEAEVSVVVRELR